MTRSTMLAVAFGLALFILMAVGYGMLSGG